MAATEREKELATKASRFIKAEVKRSGIGYKELAKRLNEQGMHETEDSITSKLVRGTFAVTFFLAVLQALDLKNMRLYDLIEC